MRRRCIYTQTRTPTAASTTTRRVPPFVAVILRLALGVGFVVVLVTLSSCLSPSTPAPSRVVTSAEESQGQMLFPMEVEDSWVVPLLLEEDFFARL